MEMRRTSVTKFIVLFLAKVVNRYMSQLAPNAVVKFVALLLMTVLLSYDAHLHEREL